MLIFNSLLSQFIGLIIYTSSCGAVQNPGMKARLSQSGLQYAAVVATQMLSTQVKTIRIPDMSGRESLDVGDVEYTFSNIRVHSFHPPRTTLSTLPFKWSLRGTSAVLKADWRYKYKLGFITFSDSGSLEVNLSLDLEATVSFNVDNTGRPTMHYISCSSHFTHVDVHFNGGAGWLYNLFDGDVEDAIRDSLKGKICNEVKNLINNKANSELATLPVSVDIREKIVLDYRLISAPILSLSYIDFPFKGEFYWKTDKQECPFTPNPIPTSISDTRMVNFWMTEYSINSLGYAEYKHGALIYNLSQADLPPDQRYFLDTTCESISKPCLGQLIPRAAQLYPNSSVSLYMIVTETPVLDVTSGGVLGNLTGLIQYYALPQNSSAKFLFSTRTKVSFTLNAKLKGKILTGNITHFKLNMSLDKSVIGNISVSILNTVIEFALRDFVIPKLNELGNEGLILPAIENVDYLNPSLHLLEHSLLIGADLKYTEN